MRPVIGVDWGTTNLRAFRYGADGTVIAKRASGLGIRQVRGGAFAEVLEALLAEWLEPASRVMIAGMAGSRDGWREVAYWPCPVALATLAGAGARVAGGGDFAILPGLSCRRADGTFDVMRGEETQILGLALPERAVVVLPGTHSKWVSVAGGRVIGFRTFMTGELFALLGAHSLLARDVAAHGDDDMTAFRRGVARAATGEALSSLLFTVRTDILSGDQERAAAADYLSGLLIGAEIGGARREYSGADPLTLVGEPALTARYALALAEWGVVPTAVVAGDVAVAAGLWRAAMAMEDKA